MATSNTKTVKTTAKTATKTATKAAAKTAVKKAAKTPEQATSKPTRKPTPITATKASTKTPRTAKKNQTAAGETATAAAGDKKVTLRGRSVFLVQTTAAGVTVRTAWMSEDKKLMDMPAVFPDVNYAINLIDDLKSQVLKHFSQAAQVGAQAIANRNATTRATKSND